jgi:hypothetical protein
MGVEIKGEVIDASFLEALDDELLEFEDFDGDLPPSKKLRL